MIYAVTAARQHFTAQRSALAHAVSVRVYNRHSLTNKQQCCNCGDAVKCINKYNSISSNLFIYKLVSESQQHDVGVTLLH